jgi:hypothetical protein
MMMLNPYLNWKAPAGLDRCRPREVRLTAQGIVLLLIGEAALVGAVLTFLALMHVATQQAQLREAGGVANATVTSLWRNRGESRPTMVAYRFAGPDGGNIYEGSAKIPLHIWRNLQVGSALQVRYDRANPSMNVPIGSENRAPPLWLAPLAALGLCALGALVTTPVVKQLRLLAEGRAAPGRVMSLKKTHKGTVVHYEFRLLSGATRTGNTGPLQKPPASGSIVPVLYDSDDPRRQAVYPLALARLRPR